MKRLGLATISHLKGCRLMEPEPWMTADQPILYTPGLRRGPHPAFWFSGKAPKGIANVAYALY